MSVVGRCQLSPVQRQIMGLVLLASRRGEEYRANELRLKLSNAPNYYTMRQSLVRLEEHGMITLDRDYRRGGMKIHPTLKGLQHFAIAKI